MKAAPLVESFQGGEFSPEVSAQVSAVRYKSALSHCENYIPQVSGPLKRRPGTQYVGTPKVSDGTPLLVPFTAPRGVGYMLELGVKIAPEVFGNWTPFSLASASWRDIAWGNGVFVAVTPSAPYVSRSTDGTNWVDVPSMSHTGQAVCYGGGTFVSVGGTSVAYSIGYSLDDGLTWSYSVTGAGNAPWMAIAYGDDTFIAVAQSGTNQIMTSPDGQNWTLRTISPPALWTNIAYGDGVFVVTNPDMVAASQIAISSDKGVTWITKTAPSAKSWSAIAYGNGIFVAVAADTGTVKRVMVSSDKGLTWTLEGPFTSIPWTDLIFDDGIFVATNSSGDFQRSTDGKTWVSWTVSPPRTWFTIGAGEGKFVAIVSPGGYGIIATHSVAQKGYARVYNADGTPVLDSEGGVYEFPVPFLRTVADLEDLHYTQSADTLYFTHPDLQPFIIKKHPTEMLWAAALFDTIEGPFLPKNTTKITLQANTRSLTPTLTASSALFKPSDTGRKIRIRCSIENWVTGQTFYVGAHVLSDSGKTYLCIKQHVSSVAPTGTGQHIVDGAQVVWQWVGNFTSATAWGTLEYATSTQAHCIADTPLNGITKTTDWYLGAWCEELGYPSVSVFYGDRLIFGGLREQPWRIDGSKVGEYTNFSISDVDGVVTDAHAISFGLVGNDFDSIHWMVVTSHGLVLGTNAGEWSLSPTSVNGTITPTSIHAEQFSKYGSADTRAFLTGSSVLFVDRSEKKVREVTTVLGYDLSKPTRDAIDMSILAEHMLTDSAKITAWQTLSTPVLWLVDSLGKLFGMTYARTAASLQVGWHRHTLGGVYPTIRRLAVQVDPYTKTDAIWMIVDRGLTGGNRTIERMIQSDTCFVDCSASRSVIRSAGQSFIPGVSYLYNVTGVVAVSSLDFTSENITVAANGFAPTTNEEGTPVYVGFPYASRGATLRQEGGSSNGTSLGKTRRTNRVGMTVLNVWKLAIGPSFTDLKNVPLNSPSFSGVLSDTVNFGYDFDNLIHWEQSGSAPGTILAIMPQLETQDRG